MESNKLASTQKNEFKVASQVRLLDRVMMPYLQHMVAFGSYQQTLENSPINIDEAQIFGGALQDLYTSPLFHYKFDAKVGRT